MANGSECMTMEMITAVIKCSQVKGTGLLHPRVVKTDT